MKNAFKFILSTRNKETEEKRKNKWCVCGGRPRIKHSWSSASLRDGRMRGHLWFVRVSAVPGCVCGWGHKKNTDKQFAHLHLLFVHAVCPAHAQWPWCGIAEEPCSAHSQKAIMCRNKFYRIFKLVCASKCNYHHFAAQEINCMKNRIRSSQIECTLFSILLLLAFSRLIHSNRVLLFLLLRRCQRAETVGSVPLRWRSVLCLLMAPVLLSPHTHARMSR